MSISSIPSSYVINLCTLLKQEGDTQTAQALMAGMAAFSASKLSEIESQNWVLHKENATKAEHYQDWTNAVAFQQEVLVYTQDACGLIHFETLEAMFKLCYYLRKMGATTDAMDTLQRLLRIVRTHLGSEHQLHAKALTEIQLVQQSLERTQGLANLSQYFDPACYSARCTNQAILSKSAGGREVRIIEKLLDRGGLVRARAVFRGWVDAGVTDSMSSEDELIDQLKKLSNTFLQFHDHSSAEVALRSVVRLCNRRNIFGDKGENLCNALMEWTSCLKIMQTEDQTLESFKISQSITSSRC